MIAFAKRVPLWLWLVLGAVGVFLVQDWRLASLRSEMQDAREAAFQDAIVEIHEQRAGAEQEKAALGAERAALLKDVAANRQALRALEGRSQAAGEATARDLAAAKALVASPTCGGLEAAAARLKVVVRCR